MKYRILYDYGSGGRSLSKEEYDTIDEAVKIAIGGYSDFLIVTIVYWEATTENKEK